MKFILFNLILSLFFIFKVNSEALSEKSYSISEFANCGSGYSCAQPSAPICCPPNGGSLSECCGDACCVTGGIYECGFTQGCIGNLCCLTDSCCGTVCCPSGESCINGFCCPATQSCGLKCCPSSEVCEGGQCVNATMANCRTCASCSAGCMNDCNGVVASFTCASLNGILAPSCTCGRSNGKPGKSGNSHFVGSLWFWIIIGVVIVAVLAIIIGVIVTRRRHFLKQQSGNINGEETPLFQ